MKLGLLKKDLQLIMETSVLEQEWVQIIRKSRFLKCSSILVHVNFGSQAADVQQLDA
jgi:hypothetical protein